MGARSKGGQSIPKEQQAGAEPQEPERQLLRYPEAAKRCGASMSSLRRWVADHEETGCPLPIVIGSGRSQTHRFWAHELDAWLASRPRHQPKRGAT